MNPRAIVPAVLLAVSVLFCAYFMSKALYSAKVKIGYVDDVVSGIESDLQELKTKIVSVKAGIINDMYAVDDEGNLDEDIPCCGGGLELLVTNENVDQIKGLGMDPETSSMMDILDDAEKKLPKTIADMLNEERKKHAYIISTITEEERERYESLKRSIYEEQVDIFESVIQNSSAKQNTNINIPKEHLNAIHDTFMEMAELDAASTIYSERIYRERYQFSW